MPTIAVGMRRFSVVSSRPFDEVVRRLTGSSGRPDMNRFHDALACASSADALAEVVRAAVGPSDLMEFARYDAGEVLRKERDGRGPKILRLVVGNPLVMKDMAKRVPDAASYAPVTILVDERADGVHLSYDSMASLLAPYDNEPALAVARDLDAKIEGLLDEAAWGESVGDALLRADTKVSSIPSSDGSPSAGSAFMHSRRKAMNPAEQPTRRVAVRSAAASQPSVAVESSDAAIQPFRVSIPEPELVELRRRIAATRWPTRELVDDRSQGVQLAPLRALASYWAAEYDWRNFEARLNALPQFTTEIDGVEIHFIHVRSRHENALPLVMTHGWPGSVVELLDTVGPLTDPTAHGGSPEDAFHLVLPSLPGYGFSGTPAELGWDSGRIARAWATLMDRLGYTRYVAQGGDVGADVTDAMGRQGAKGLVGIHLNLLTGALGIADRLPAKSDEERTALAAVGTFKANGFGYFLEQSTRPQTIGYSLLDSPVGLAAWLLDHDTDSYYKISRAFVHGEPAGHLTRDSILDNITLYWLTGTGASAARWYWEFGQTLAAAIAAGGAPPAVKVPVGFTTFPGELWAAPRSWVEAVYPGHAYFNHVDRGGHFAAWEEPALFTSELRAAFKPLR
jgi:hypothetical protein